MYRPLTRPRLPRLILDRELDDSSIFSLDWTHKETTTKENFRQWLCKKEPTLVYLIPEKYENFLEAFPREFNDTLYGLRFKLNSEYQAEIAHETEVGVNEWNRSRHLDTVVREYCLKGAIQHFDTAFYLLSDCLVFPDGKWRRTERRLGLMMMLYKFWDGQTGRALVRNHAKIDALSTEAEDDGQKFLLAVNKSEQEREEFISSYNFNSETEEPK